MKAIELKRVSLSDMENLSVVLFVNASTADDKYSLLNGDNFNAINSDAII